MNRAQSFSPSLPMTSAHKSSMPGTAMGSLWANLQGCVPFECFEGKDVQLFIDKKSLGEYGVVIARSVVQIIVAGLIVGGAVIGATGPIGAVLVAAYEVLAPVCTWLNNEINKRRMLAEQQTMLASSANAILNNIITFLEIRYPWCSAVEKIRSNPAFADNSPIFGSDGPAMGIKFMGIYMMAAALLHNKRYGKTSQKILAVAPLSETLDEVHYVKNHLMIKVSNIEHYWRGDEIVIRPNQSEKIIVTHRSGNSKKITWDCDRVFYDPDIVPSGIFESGRGCKMSMTWRYDGQANSMGGGRSGTNLRNLEGEGWLITSIDYSASHQSLVGKTVNVKKEFLIAIPSDATTTATTTTTKPPMTVTPTPGNLTLTDKIKAGFSGYLATIILMGIGATLIYQAISNSRSDG